MPRHCALTVRAHCAVTSAATAQTLQSLRVHCSDTEKVTARSLRRQLRAHVSGHCADTKVTARSLLSHRALTAQIAQTLYAHCSVTPAAVTPAEDTARSSLCAHCAVGTPAAAAAATAQKTPRAPHCARSSLRRYHVSSRDRSYLCTHCAVVTAQPRQQ
jgi:hypothetical protein